MDAYQQDIAMIKQAIEAGKAGKDAPVVIGLMEGFLQDLESLRPGGGKEE